MSEKNAIERFEYKLQKMKVWDEILSSKKFLKLKDKKGERKSKKQRDAEQEVENEIKKLAEKMISILSKEDLKTSPKQSQEQQSKPNQRKKNPRSAVLITNFSVSPENMASKFPPDSQVRIQNIEENSEGEEIATILNKNGDRVKIETSELNI